MKEVLRLEIVEIVDESMRYHGIILEQINDKFQMILEVFEVLRADIKRVDDKLEAFREGFNFRLDILEKRVAGLEAKS